MFKNLKLFLRNNLYYVLLSLVLIISMILLLVLGYLNLIIDSNINAINLYGDKNQVRTINTQLQINFKPKAVSTESQKQEIIQSIKLDPPVKFTPSWIKNNLILNFDTRLSSDTKYNLVVPDINRDFKYDFRTQVQKMTYLVKNYTSKTADKIILTDAKMEDSKNIFELENISFYDINYKYLAAGIDDGAYNVNKIYFKNLETGETKLLQSPGVTYSGISVAHDLSEVLILVKDASDVHNEKNLIKKYNFETEEYTDFNYPPTPYSLRTIKYSPNDDYITYVDTVGNTFLSRNIDIAIPSLISKYRDVTDLDTLENRFIAGSESTGDNINLNYLIYNIQDDKTTPILNQGLEGLRVIDPAILNYGNQIIYSAGKSLSNGNTFYSLFKLDLDKSGKPVQIFMGDGESYELAKITADDKYMAVEKSLYKDDVSERVVREEGRSVYTSIIVYNLKDNTFIDKQISGSDVEWVD